MPKPLVSICCLAYNHEPYIRECLEGFIMQKTKFSFEILIHDDASIDHTANIIREYEAKYPEVVKPIYQTENQYSKGVSITFVYQFARAKGKYIAICEGDDYWIDPYKLQKQLDFLEANEDYGAVFTDADHLIQKTDKLIKSYDKKHRRQIPTGEVFKELLYCSPYKTCTAFFHRELIKNVNYQFLNNKRFLMGDKIIWLHIAANKKIGYLNESTAVYRVLESSASNFDNMNGYISFYDSSNQISKCFALHYGVPINEEYQKSQLNRLIATRYLNRGNYKLALKYSNSFSLLAIIFFKEKIARKILNLF